MILYVSGSLRMESLIKELSTKGISKKYLLSMVPKMDRLLSYNDLKNKQSIKDCFPSYCNRVFLDSGAWSAYSVGAVLDINKYILFIKENKKYFEAITSLDVIGNEIKSKENFIKMKKEGCDVIPCFHCGESFELLKFYADNCNYIGLGGMVNVNYKQRRHFLSKCFQMFPDNSKIKFHGFGVTDIKLLLEFPFYSVDSTALLRSGINRSIFFNGKLVSVGKHFHQKKGDLTRSFIKELSIKYLKKDYSDILIGDNNNLQMFLLIILNFKIFSEFLDNDKIYTTRCNFFDL